MSDPKPHTEQQESDADAAPQMLVVPTGSAGVVHLRSTLRRGHTLASYLLALPLEEGEVIAYVPPGSDLTRLTEFSYASTLLPSELLTLMPHHLAQYLQLPGRRSIIFEDSIFRANDWPRAKERARAEGDVLTQHVSWYGQELYCWLTQDDATNVARIDETFGSVLWYPTIGALATAREGEAWPVLKHENALGYNDLRLLAAHPDEIIVDAYDTDGALVWYAPWATPRVPLPEVEPHSGDVTPDSPHDA